MGRFDAYGVVDETSKNLTPAFKKKDYLGDVVSREIRPWLSMPFLSKGTRCEAASQGTTKSDISNAVRSEVQLGWRICVECRTYGSIDFIKINV